MPELSEETVAKVLHDLVELRFYLETLYDIVKSENISNDAKVLCEGAIGRVGGVIEFLKDKPKE